MQDERRFSKILVAIDGSDLSMKAADYAIDEAKKYGATVTALYVIRIPSGVYDLVIFPYDEIIKKDTEDAEKWFDIIRKKAQENNISLKTNILDEIRPPAQVIVEYAEKQGIDLIVVGTTGKTGFKKILLGSVASGVITYSSCPVLVVK
jgi:nucleotide-binding universal stress UspA family protein